MFARFLRIRFFAMFALALVLAAAAYGFAAANTVPASYAGDGSNTITGYVITNVHYTLAAPDPSANIASVDFTIAPVVPATGSTLISVDGGTTWVSCTTGAAAVTCAAPGVTPATASTLQVVAAE